MNTLIIDTPISSVARIQLNRPDKSNAFDPELINELTQTLNQFSQDDAVRIIILTGNGPHFSAGADVQWMQQMVNATEEQNKKDALALSNLMQTLYEFPKPTLACVRGAAMGGAIGLIACCDIAMASTDSYFCFSEVKIGLIPAVISPFIIKAIGVRHTRRYFLTAEKISAHKAMELGLIHEYVEEKELNEKVLSVASLLLKNSPAALSECKQLIFHVADHPIDHAIQDETASFIARIRVSEEGQEGLRAFLDKRSPSWQSEK